MPLSAPAPRLLVLSLLAWSPLSGQTEAERPTARAVRVDIAPVIDGRVDDDVWLRAEPIGELTQVEPTEGAEPSERTEVRVLYDNEYLYIGARCFDRAPEEIVATTRSRDAWLDPDDRIELVLDSFLDRRSAYFFQMNPAGAKGDARISNNGSTFNDPWDGIWEGRASIDDLGWSAELAIPFKTLNFDEELGTWGFNFRRVISRKLERNHWAGARRGWSFYNVAHAGNLRGLEGMEQGLGIDVVPYFTSRWRRERGADGRMDGAVVTGEPGIDAFFRVTPGLNLGVTFNTDFAETEVDTRQNNLTRFPISFPERRDFFLQDGGLFDFPGDTTPFFSRRIGLTDRGEEVPILAGTRLTGRLGAYNLGIVDVQTDDATVLQGDGSHRRLGGQNLFAARVSRDLGEQSTIGGIVTNGDPNGGPNTVVGFDARYRTSEFRGDRNLVATAWGIHANSDEHQSDEMAFGAGISYPNDLWGWGLSFAEVQENYDPALGFVRRRDIRRYSGRLSYEPRSNLPLIRDYEFSLNTDFYTTTGNVSETWETELQPFGVAFESGDGFRFEVERTRDGLFDDFEIRDGIVIPIDSYDFTRVRFETESARRRQFSARLAIELGDFYDGSRERYTASVAWIPSALFTGQISTSHNEIHLPAGDFATQFTTLRATFTFTPEIAWSNFLQWDNESDEFGIFSRLFWTPEPGREIYVVFNESLAREDGDLSTRFQEMSFKIGYTFRF